LADLIHSNKFSDPGCLSALGHQPT
jgi:hypothetical protein